MWIMLKYFHGDKLQVFLVAAALQFTANTDFPSGVIIDLEDGTIIMSENEGQRM